MREVLINSWNAQVGPTDLVYHLGDFSFHEREVEAVLHRLNGTKHLILGNHDKPHSSNKGKTPEKYHTWVQKYLDLGWASVQTQLELVLEDERFALCHFPYEDVEDTYQDQPTTIRYLKHRPKDEGLTLLCGHVHERWLTKRTSNGTLMLNVGVDAPGATWYMRPASLEEVLNEIKKN
jgi:calcineurin-like phosphoesterase family protein